AWWAACSCSASRGSSSTDSRGSTTRSGPRGRPGGSAQSRAPTLAPGADARASDRELTLGRPAPHVLDVPERLPPVLAGQRIVAGRVPFHREEVEAAVGTEDVEILRQVRTVPPRTASLSLARRDVEPAARARPEPFPSGHVHRLRLPLDPGRTGARRVQRPPAVDPNGPKPQRRD